MISTRRRWGRSDIVWSSFWEASPGSRRHTRARELTDLLHSLHERFRCLQYALAGGSDLLQNLLLVYEHVHLVLDALRQGLTQRFGLLAETLGGRAQLFGA